ncbi:transcription initiation factor TFIID subunit 6 isoform X2 [Argentina anserina]|uniref:transcription initiation factor TFIID subunit 6 isoform X2 n=1 Tax=Argentina anserina TaxID=57926 RepID=UPI002176429D|nr:transcription initiation factor TFIID subunit 6 isoform X2 [Potentilla anserina]
MSIVPKENIEVISQSIGINNLSPEVALDLAPDVEYRLREVMQEAIKCMRHSRRTELTADDVDGALNLRNVEPLYGFVSGGPLQFKKAVGHRDLFYIDDKDVDFKDVIEAPLPKAPLDTGLVCHWLAIEGVQPAIPENAHVEAPSDGKKYEQKDDGLPVELKLPVKHVLSKELQLYFDKITELVMSRSDDILLKKALLSLSTDSGLHPLVPYFTCFIADEVSRGLSDYPLLFALMRVVYSLLQNPHIHIEPYLHQLMPSVVTCLVAKRLGNRFADNHWELRDFTANLVASICKRFGHVYNTLQSRLTKTLVNAFLDPKRSLTQHYGAIQGLAALGPSVVHLLILPNLESYLRLLEPELLLEKQKNEIKRHEAWRVYGALLSAAGQCIYDRLKIFPTLLSPVPHSLWKTNERVVLTTSNKRKRSVDLIEQQPPLKKIATDGPTDLTNSSPSPMQVETTTPALSGDTNAGPSSSTILSNESIPKGRGRQDGADAQSLKKSAILNQVWKEELNSGKLLVSLFQLFGEDILPFIPAPEMSLFL